MPQKMGFYWDDESNNCFSTIASMYLFLPCVIIGVTTLAVLTWRLRRVRDAFNEYRETRYGVILLLVAFAINTILMATGYGRYRWAKHILVVISFLWGNLYFWMVMGKPIYGYLFDRNRCQERFVAGLEIDTCQYMEYTRNKSDSKTKMVSQSRYFDLDIRKNSQAHSVNPRSMHSQQHRVTRKTTNYGWDSPTDRSDHCVEEDEEGTATGRYVPPLPLSAYPMHTIPAKHQNNSGEDASMFP
ncbi:hypothetical protein BDF22DRAFT_302765 [Syncephalis plumigaleata]|nr:hypothetical protein BDF22DRAFT_302765 [Syncephalis plumigaleata]